MKIKLSIFFISLFSLTSVANATDLDNCDISVCTAKVDNRSGLFKKKLLLLRDEILDFMSRGRDRNCEISELLGKMSHIKDLSSDIHVRYSNIKFAKPRGHENQSLSQLFEPRLELVYDKSNTARSVCEISVVFDESIDIEDLIELPLKSLIKIKYAADQEKKISIENSEKNISTQIELGFDVVYHKIKLAKYYLENKKFFVSCIFLREALNSIKQILASVEDAYNDEIIGKISNGNLPEPNDRNERKRKRLDALLDLVDSTCMGLCIYPRIGDQVL